ncbi:MAG: hypothetical protein VYB91_03370, partial [Pseudomonadota bacterium]|nr:hypothetical protein [Pseudomonadota bacterium]
SVASRTNRRDQSVRRRRRMRVSGNFLLIMAVSASRVFIARLSGGGNLFVSGLSYQVSLSGMMIAISA